MQKKMPVSAAIVIVLLTCLATFMLSFICLHTVFEKRYRARTVEPYGKIGAYDTAGTSSEGSSGAENGNSGFMQRATAKLSEVDALFRQYYIGDLDDDLLIDCMIDGYIAGTLDNYGAYYNTAEFEDFMSDLEGEIAGIGVNVIQNADYKCLEVLSVIPDSPAMEAGVEPGDLIWTVGEEKESVVVLGYYPSIAKLRGAVGTEAIFSVRRGDQYEEEVDFRITREIVKEVTVMSHVYAPDPSIGVVRISGFDASTPKQFVDATKDLTDQGCAALVIDLRYNPGGELNSILTVLDYILPAGPIVRIMDKDGNQVQAYNSGPTELSIPLAVLVNGSTASAAELFTSAVRDYEKAIIVGTTTYGKGCMQTTVPLSDNSAVSITYRMYNPPFSDNYHGIGIVPDVEVELDEELQGKNFYKITDEEDNQLAAAAAALRY